MVSPDVVGLVIWAIVAALPVAWVSRQLFHSRALMSLVLLISVVLASLPWFFGASLASWLYGYLDLPSLLLVGLLVMRLYRPEDDGLRALWHLGGLLAVGHVLAWSVGCSDGYFWGDEPT